VVTVVADAALVVMEATAMELEVMELEVMGAPDLY